MAELTVQTATQAGLDPSYAAASSGGDTVDNDGKTVLHVKNGDSSEHTVTVASQVTSPEPGTAAQDVEVAIPAGEERVIGPFQRSGFNDENDEIEISYDGVTDVTIAALSVDF